MFATLSASRILQKKNPLIASPGALIERCPKIEQGLADARQHALRVVSASPCSPRGKSSGPDGLKVKQDYISECLQKLQFAANVVQCMVSIVPSDENPKLEAHLDGSPGLQAMDSVYVAVDARSETKSTQHGRSRQQAGRFLRAENNNIVHDEGAPWMDGNEDGTPIHPSNGTDTLCSPPRIRQSESASHQFESTAHSTHDHEVEEHGKRCEGTRSGDSITDDDSAIDHNRVQQWIADLLQYNERSTSGSKLAHDGVRSKMRQRLDEINNLCAAADKLLDALRNEHGSACTSIWNSSMEPGIERVRPIDLFCDDDDESHADLNEAVEEILVQASGLIDSGDPCWQILADCARYACVRYVRDQPIPDWSTYRSQMNRLLARSPRYDAKHNALVAARQDLQMYLRKTSCSRDVVALPHNLQLASLNSSILCTSVKQLEAQWASTRADLERAVEAENNQSEAGDDERQQRLPFLLRNAHLLQDAQDTLQPRESVSSGSKARSRSKSARPSTSQNKRFQSNTIEREVRRTLRRRS